MMVQDRVEPNSAYGFEFNLELISASASAISLSFLKNSQVQINFKLNEKNRIITY